ncbi:MAG: hypothetical protein QOJ19_3008 [Acidimicrobiia bacterium]|jgi:hypothetical protein|nr:hypothetical protein [Acidimicrobiia bacterium]
MSQRNVALCILPLPLVAMALWQLEIEQLLGLLSVLLTTAGACAWSLWHGRASRPARVRVPGRMWGGVGLDTACGAGAGAGLGLGSWSGDAGSGDAGSADAGFARSTALASDDVRVHGAYVAHGLAELETFLGSVAAVGAGEDEPRPTAS